MGIENIIKNRPTEEETPSTGTFPQNDPFFDDEDPPVVIDIYSDSSSDTESFSEMNDADELLEIIELPSYISSICNSDNEEEVEAQVHFLEIPNQPNELQNAVEKEKKPETNHQTNVIRRVKSISSKSRSGNMGKKKARRLENARQLDLLVGDEKLHDSDINDFMPIDCSFRFSQILEDSDLANKILDSIDKFDDVDLDETHSKKKKPQSSSTIKLSADDAFNNLDASEKTFFRRRNLPRGMVEYLDTCVLSFFENNPTGTYISEPLSSFERMMLHSIAHYYELNSYSFDIEKRNARFTKVTNNLDYFNPPHLCLSQYLEDHLLKNTGCSPAKRRRFRKK